MIGFITPLTHNFCESCNRVRVTCTGRLTCVWGTRSRQICALRCALRGGTISSNAAVRDAITRKPKGHDFVIDRTERKPAVPRHMSVTGG